MKNDRLLKVSGCAMLLCGAADLIWLIYRAYAELSNPVVLQIILDCKIPLFFPLCGNLLILGLLKIATGLSAVRTSSHSSLPLILGITAAALNTLTMILAEHYPRMTSLFLLTAGALTAMLLIIATLRFQPDSRHRISRYIGINLLLCALIALCYTFLYLDQCLSATGVFLNQTALRISMKRTSIPVFACIAVQITSGILAFCRYHSKKQRLVRLIPCVLTILLNVVSAYATSYAMCQYYESFPAWFVLNAAVSAVYLLTLFRIRTSDTVPETSTDNSGE